MQTLLRLDLRHEAKSDLDKEASPEERREAILTRSLLDVKMNYEK